jgi:hypothetical protein
MGVERRTSETGDWRERGEWKGERREAGGGEAWRRGQTANGEWRGARREWIGEACEDNQEVPESAIKTGPTNTHTHTHTHTLYILTRRRCSLQKTHTVHLNVEMVQKTHPPTHTHTHTHIHTLFFRFTSHPREKPPYATIHERNKRHSALFGPAGHYLRGSLRTPVMFREVGLVDS